MHSDSSPNLGFSRSMKSFRQKVRRLPSSGWRSETSRDNHPSARLEMLQSHVQHCPWIVKMVQQFSHYHGVVEAAHRHRLFEVTLDKPDTRAHLLDSLASRCWANSSASGSMSIPVTVYAWRARSTSKMPSLQPTSNTLGPRTSSAIQSIRRRSLWPVGPTSTRPRYTWDTWSLSDATVGTLLVISSRGQNPNRVSEPGTASRIRYPVSGRHDRTTDVSALARN